MVEAEGSTFAIVLNDIYEVTPSSHHSLQYAGTILIAAELIFVLACMQTLMDPHKRAAYDNIFGFDEDATNPFKDATESRDQVLHTPFKHAEK